MNTGTIALLGRPNAGKSTLLNRLLGGKLAITSAKPQTTRDRIMGVYSAPGVQLVLIDTPGIHIPHKALNERIVARAREAARGVDAACWVGDMTVLAQRLDADKPLFDEVEEAVAAVLAQVGCPIVFVANKIDVVPYPLLLPVIDQITKAHTITAAVPVSALTGDGVDRLLAELTALAPEGPALYPEDHWTDVSERFLVAEIIREKVFHLTEREIPYSTAIEIRSFDESEREAKGNVRIDADIILERDSQKGIVIGKRAAMLKRIGTLARKEIQKVLGCRVHLALRVKVEKNWTRTERGLNKVGYK